MITGNATWKDLQNYVQNLATIVACQTNGPITSVMSGQLREGELNPLTTNTYNSPPQPLLQTESDGDVLRDLQGWVTAAVCPVVWCRHAGCCPKYDIQCHLRKIYGMFESCGCSGMFVLCMYSVLCLVSHDMCVFSAVSCVPQHILRTVSCVPRHVLSAVSCVPQHILRAVSCVPRHVLRAVSGVPWHVCNQCCVLCPMTCMYSVLCLVSHDMYVLSAVSCVPWHVCTQCCVLCPMTCMYSVLCLVSHNIYSELCFVFQDMYSVLCLVSHYMYVIRAVSGVPQHECTWAVSCVPWHVCTQSHVLCPMTCMYSELFLVSHDMYVLKAVSCVPWHVLRDVSCVPRHVCTQSFVLCPMTCTQSCVLCPMTCMYSELCLVSHYKYVLRAVSCVPWYVLRAVSCVPRHVLRHVLRAVSCVPWQVCTQRYVLWPMTCMYSELCLVGHSHQNSNGVPCPMLLKYIFYIDILELKVIFSININGIH